VSNKSNARRLVVVTGSNNLNTSRGSLPSVSVEFVSRSFCFDSRMEVVEGKWSRGRERKCSYLHFPVDILQETDVQIVL
jgi:hypothetical protein